ncbi:hypothetical protein C357_07876 [Citreicella sp. 357]|nr:hypothetical protein C357_07876 [Citreicella sp. 357]
MAGALFSALNIPLRAAFLYDGFGGAFDPMMLQIALSSPFGLWIKTDVIGLPAIATIVLKGGWTRPFAPFGVALVAISFALRGHATGDPQLALSILFVIHILAASCWIGGFFPLYDMAGRGSAAAAIHSTGDGSLRRGPACHRDLYVHGRARPHRINRQHGAWAAAQSRPCSGPRTPRNMRTSSCPSMRLLSAKVRGFVFTSCPRVKAPVSTLVFK